MEGPSLKIAAEELQPFVGKVIKEVTGNTKIGKEQFLDKQVKDIFSWGKHLVFQFDTIAFRIHFMMFGSYRAEVLGQETEGDYKKSKDMPPRLALFFENGNIKTYSCSIKLLETENAKATYDFSADVLSSTFNKDKAFEKVRAQSEKEISDILLDQDIFAGVGNIIRNEVLWYEKTVPQTLVKNIPDDRLKAIIERQVTFSFQFYEWRKVYQLKKHLQIYKKKECPVCGSKTIKHKTGALQRMSHYCNICQQ